jgi:uncharacterized phage protein (TIGR02220 family)
MSSENTKGFAEYLKSQDPDGQYTTNQVKGLKGYYTAGWDACNGKKNIPAIYKSRVSEVIKHFNEVAGKNVRDTPSHTKAIKGRLIEEYTVDELKSIIDYVVLDWTGKMFGDTKGETYIRIATLFGSSDKVDKYLGLAEVSQAAVKAKTAQIITKKVDTSQFKGSF